ncbi:MAG: esterase-like activity of phytase family protein [Planctomycetota bacterium]
MLTHLLLAVATTQPAPRAELVGFAVLPADTFRPGPTSGQFIDPANGRTPPFVDKQPVQGISSMIATDTPGTYFALSDNGFGAKRNSADYVLCVYEITPDFETGEVAWELAFELSDPDDILDWPIVAEMETYPDSDIPVPADIKEGRKLTGADFDIESMVRLPDGTFWIGDEFGPFLLHFDAEGKLLEPPVELPGEGMHSPDHPTKDPAKAKIARSAGFEGLAYLTWQVSEEHAEAFFTEVGTEAHVLYAMLEKPIADENLAKIYEGEYLIDMFVYDEEGTANLTRTNAAQSGKRRMSQGSSSIGASSILQVEDDLPTQFLTLERDSKEGGDAIVKRLSVDSVVHHDDGTFTARPVPIADLLDIADPNDLDADGLTDFRFPFVTIESVVVVDERTVLICNDNNFPFSNGRSATEPDHTEFILVRLPEPLSEIGRE